MAKGGKLAGCAAKTVARSKSVGHGPASKNVVRGGRSAGRPSGPTGPIKGSDRGGV